MRIRDHFRRLPPLLRALSALGLLALLTAMVVLVVAILIGVTTLRAFVSSAQMAPLPGGVLELGVVGMTLVMIGGAFIWPTNMYRARLRHPGRAGLRLETWQEQVAAALVLAALPLCVLIATLLLFPTNTQSPTNMGFASALLVVSAALNLVEALLLLAAQVWIVIVSLG